MSWKAGNDGTACDNFNFSEAESSIVTQEASNAGNSAGFTRKTTNWSIHAIHMCVGSSGDSKATAIRDTMDS